MERSPKRPLPTGDGVWKLAGTIAPCFRALILVAAFVGPRRGELAALRRADIDIDIEHSGFNEGPNILDIDESPVQRRFGSIGGGARSRGIPPPALAEQQHGIDQAHAARLSGSTCMRPTGSGVPCTGGFHPQSRHGTRQQPRRRGAAAGPPPPLPTGISPNDPEQVERAFPPPPARAAEISSNQPPLSSQAEQPKRPLPTRPRSHIEGQRLELLRHPPFKSGYRSDHADGPSPVRQC